MSMLGKTLIDGLDIYAHFGAYISYGGFNDMANFPNIKKVDSVNWPEEDGEEFDLLGIKLDTQAITIGFVANNAAGLVQKLSDGAYHNFTFTSIGVNRRLRLLSQPNFEVMQGLNIFKLKFADDFPLLDYSYLAPVAQVNMKDYGCKLDGRNFNQYDVAILEGLLDGLLKAPDVKKNLTVNTSSIAGVVYDDAIVRYQIKEVKIPCFMCSTTAAGFWHNRNALLFDLARPNERQLMVEGKVYLCYYKSCQTKEFVIVNGRAWWKFDLTFCFTNYRP